MGISHTPGPWHVVPYGDGDSLVVCSDTDGEWRICFMATHGGTESVWDAIQANARLIAAAPDLFEAGTELQAARKAQNADPSAENASRVRAASDAFDAALSKATAQQEGR